MQNKCSLKTVALLAPGSKKKQNKNKKRGVGGNIDVCKTFI